MHVRLSMAAIAVLSLSSAAALIAAPLKEPIQPIPDSLNVPPKKAELGRQLFRDPRLSANGAVSCATCHDLGRGGVDGKPHSPGFKGAMTGVNTPTVLNSALNFRQFWDGRADSLEGQIDSVIQNPVEMGSKWEEVVAWISKDGNYSDAFGKTYKDGVTKANIIDALASFERTLITPNSRFDKYLKGDANAITEVEKSGYLKFKQYGCVACHQGMNVGGNMFQTFGAMGDYFKSRGNGTTADLGRYNVTRLESDKHVFKVPSLRNVALTAPYFHDGTAKTLEEAVDVMFKYQLGRSAPKEDKEQIIEFLKTLTGQVPGQIGVQPNGAVAALK
ncbi:MAG: cytochrome c peroxidase [Burkholderiales bacterium]